MLYCDLNAEDWGKAQQHPGVALQQQGVWEDGFVAGLSLLEPAVNVCRAALGVRKRDAMPVQWVMRLGSTAVVLMVMPEREPEQAEAHLRQALRYVDLALEVFDPKHMPYDFGTATRLRDRIAGKLTALEGGAG